jgi:hypothetical protein
MARSDDPIAKLYEHRRSYPDAKPHDRFPRPQDAARYHEHREIQQPQAPEDQHGPGYSNDVSKRSWLQSGVATDKQFFDRGNSWRKGREASLDWSTGSDLRHPGERGLRTKAERNKP